MVIQRFLTSLLLCITLLPGIVMAEATAKVDRTSVGIDETFTLSVTIDDTSFFSDPDTSALENNFTILGHQQSTQSSIINGHSSSLTEWDYQLAPKTTGILTIPPIDIGGEKTRPIIIKVTDTSSSSTTDSSKPTFLEAVVDKSSVYVQQQILFTLRINTSENLQNLQLNKKLDVPNAFVVQASNTQYERYINNVRYTTYELVYAIFPQSSGTLDIPSITAYGVNPGRSTFNSFFGGGRQIQLRSKPVSVDVQPIPPSAGNNPWLPAKSLTLSETWSADPENIQVGDSITRSITTTAEGLSANQLPAISVSNDSHFKIYPDQPSTNDAKNNQGIVGERKDAITLVAIQPGEVTLPAIHIQWWDIENNVMKTATLSAVTLKIHGSTNNNITATMPPSSATNAPIAVVPQSQQQPTPVATTTTNTDNTSTATKAAAVLPWQIATAISACLALAFMLLFIWQYQRNKQIADHITPASKVPVKTEKYPLR